MPLFVCRHADHPSEWNAVVEAETVTLGFSEGANVPLPDRDLSASEARIVKVGDRFALEDLAEKDRVRLNGSVTRRSSVRDGDSIQIGRILIRFYEEEPRADTEVRLQAGVGAGGDRTISYSRLFRFPAAPAAGGVEAPRSTPSRIPLAAMMAVCLAAGAVAGFSLAVGGRRPPPPVPPPVAPPSAPGAAASPEAQGALELEGGRTGPGQKGPGPKIAPLEGAPPGRSSPGSAPGGDAVGAVEAAVAAPADVAPSPGASGPPAGPPSASLDALRKSLQKAATDDDSAPALPGPDDPERARLRIFRLFLDAARRPPTRGEERALAPLGPEERWARLLEVAAPDAKWADSPEESYRALLGRDASPQEAEAVRSRATSRRPPGFWVAWSEEYARPERRRPRGPDRRAASLVVDLLDRPATAAEIGALVEALASRNGVLEAVRIVALSPGSGVIPGGETVAWWEDEFFRFYLRLPNEKERLAVPPVLERLDGGRRRTWFLMTLASSPDYESY